MKVEFDNSEYIASHGKAPRGDGLWALQIVFRDGRGGYFVADYWRSGKLTDVKRLAKQYAQGNAAGATSAKISILP